MTHGASSDATGPATAVAAVLQQLGSSVIVSTHVKDFRLGALFGGAACGIAALPAALAVRRVMNQQQLHIA
jgi:hypothetical protein